MNRGLCGHRFEAEMLDREDPREQPIYSEPVRCPNFNRTMVEKDRVIRWVVPPVS